MFFVEVSTFLSGANLFQKKGERNLCPAKCLSKVKHNRSGGQLSRSGVQFIIRHKMFAQKVEQNLCPAEFRSRFNTSEVNNNIAILLPKLC